MGERLAGERLAGERLASERLASERLASERLVASVRSGGCGCAERSEGPPGRRSGLADGLWGGGGPRRRLGSGRILGPVNNVSPARGG